jgi:hypothetical protein
MWRRVRSALRHLLVAIAAVLVTLATAEISLRLIGLGDPILYDNRGTYGYRPLPDQTRRRLFGARVHVNHLGLRGPDAEPDALSVLFLGDSVTWGGSYVDDAQLFAAVATDALGRRLSRAVVPLDAGVNAWGPQNIAALLEERGGFGARFWVLTLLEDDFRREKTHVGEVPYFNLPPRTALEELAVLASYKIVGAYKRAKPPADLDRIAEENLAACRRIFEMARATGTRLLVVWHPSAGALAGDPEPRKAALLAVAAAGGVPVLDLTSAYQGRGGLYQDGLHLSVAGHQVAGAAIGARLGELASVDGNAAGW